MCYLNFSIILSLTALKQAFLILLVNAGLLYSINILGFFVLWLTVKEMQELSNLFRSSKMHAYEEKVKDQAPDESHFYDP